MADDPTLGGVSVKWNEKGRLDCRLRATPRFSVFGLTDHAVKSLGDRWGLGWLSMGWVGAAAGFLLAPYSGDHLSLSSVEEPPEDVTAN